METTRSQPRQSRGSTAPGTYPAKGLLDWHGTPFLLVMRVEPEQAEVRCWMSDRETPYDRSRKETQMRAIVYHTYGYVPPQRRTVGKTC